MQMLDELLFGHKTGRDASGAAKVDSLVERLATQRSTETSKRARKEDEHLPLHAVPGIKGMSMTTIRTLALQYAKRHHDAEFDRLRRRMDEGLLFVESSRPFRDACAGIDKDRKKISYVSDIDIESLLKADVIEAATRPALRTGRLFSVVEAHKKRRRSIYWPKWLNYELTVMGIPTPLLADVLCSAFDVRPGTFARCFDLSSSFYQVELAEHIRDYFQFVTQNGKRFRLKKMPMGCCTSPEVLQSIVSLLAHMATEGMHAVVDVTVHIDNVRFSGLSPSLVEKAGNNFVALCQKAGVQLNDEPENSLHQNGKFLGMCCNYETGEVHLTPESIEKLHSRAEAAKGAAATVQDLFSLFGSLSFCGRVLRVPPAAHYTTYKYIRRLASKYVAGSVTLDSPAELWKCARADIDLWLKELEANKPVRHVDPLSAEDEPLVMISDASTEGWGAIMCDERTGEVWQAAGHWGQKEDCSDINTLEMIAVRLGLKAFSKILTRDSTRPLIILVDNTSTMAVLRKGTAREFSFNEATLSTLRCLAGDRQVSVGWISSTNNFADPLSRGEPARQSDEELVSALGAFGRRLGRSALRVRVPAEIYCSQSNKP